MIFTHSLVSDWNHGNAHFVRGIASELLSRGHELSLYEPEDGWSRQMLLREHGQKAIDGFENYFPHLRSTLYNEETVELDHVLRNIDIVIVHEWNTPTLVSRIGHHRTTHDYRLLFHDTHHRSLSDMDGIARYDLGAYDTVLAYGNVIRDAYLRNGWTKNATTWHEAADVRVFKPMPSTKREGDLVWIGNWGDNERARTLREFLIEPVKRLRLRARVYGVRYPDSVLEELNGAGIEYGGWLANYKVPEIFSRYGVTIHVPRQPYVHALPGIPTIRPFEALACGIPLISAPWSDSEHLFRPGKDFLFAHNGNEMEQQLTQLLSKPEIGNALAAHGLETIRARHTCGHRVDELLTLVESRQMPGALQEVS